MAHRVVVGLGGSSRALIVGLLLAGCGSADEEPAAAGSTNVPGYAGDLPTTAGADGDADDPASGGAESGTPGTGEVSGSGALAQCRGRFEPCGGALLGDWQVEGTCEPDAQDREEARRWSADVLRLDALACSDAVQTLTSLWSGALGFRDGEALDSRSRADEVRLRLTSECLTASRSELAGFTDLSAACSSLAGESAVCGVVDGACNCWLEREAQPDERNFYAVISNSVVIGSERVDYCVDNDRLHWQQPGSDQHLVLRRVAYEPPIWNPK